MGVAGVLAVAAASAEIYRWTDSNGKAHFSDRPSVAYSSETVELRINTYEGVSYESAKAETESGNGVRNDVIMYSAAWCGVCKRARRYFQQNRIAFTEYDIDSNARARTAYRKLGAKGVPVILVGNRRMNGFSAEGFEKLYR